MLEHVHYVTRVLARARSIRGGPHFFAFSFAAASFSAFCSGGEEGEEVYKRCSDTTSPRRSNLNRALSSLSFLQPRTPPKTHCICGLFSVERLVLCTQLALVGLGRLQGLDRAARLRRGSESDEHKPGHVLK